jgi:hypothetical protein
MTSRGVEAVRMPPRAMWIRRVFNVHGRPISWPYFTREVWHPARNWPALRSARHTRCATPSRTGRSARACRSRRWPARWATPRRSGRSLSTAAGATRWAPTPPCSENHGRLAQIRHQTLSKPSRRASVRVPLPALPEAARPPRAHGCILGLDVGFLGWATLTDHEPAVGLADGFTSPGTRAIRRKERGR